MKRFFVFALRLLVLGAIVYAAVTCGLFSPGGIPGNSRYDELEFTAFPAGSPVCSSGPSATAR